MTSLQVIGCARQNEMPAPDGRGHWTALVRPNLNTMQLANSRARGPELAATGALETIRPARIAPKADGMISLKKIAIAERIFR
jgi:hypothetical protein